MSLVDIGMYLTYILLIGAAALAIGLSVLNMIKTPGAFVRSLYGIVGVIVLFGISYAISGSDISAAQKAKGITEGVSKFVGAGLIMFYCVCGIAVLGLIFSEINKALK